MNDFKIPYTKLQVQWSVVWDVLFLLNR